MPVSHKLQLEWRTPGVDPAPDTVFRFDVPGVPVPRFVPQVREASEPREVEQVRTVLEFEGARLDGWSRVLALRDLISSRVQPTKIQLVADAGSEDETVVWTIESPAYEEIQVNEVRGIPTDDLMPAASWLTVCPLTVEVSCVKKNADARGIVGWQQRVSKSYDRGGLEQITWELDVTTVVGTDAREKVRQYGRVLQELLGGTYTYLTQGDDGSGVEVSYEADEDAEWVPTRASGVSRVRQWGIVVSGTTTPGGSVGEVSYSVTERVEKGIAETHYDISAAGPGHNVWVRSRAPTNEAEAVERSVVDHWATRETVGRWVFRGTATEEDKLKRTVRVEISGGHESFDYEIAADGYAPVEFEGGLEPWTVNVLVDLERAGGDGTNKELPLPQVLTSIGLRLDRNASVEGEPYIAEHAATQKDGTAKAATWKREARLVYRAATKPSVAQVRAVIDQSQETVESYYL